MRCIATTFATLTLVFTTAGWAQPLTLEEQLGKAIFFDKALSINGNQSCADCHDPAFGWTGPIEEINEAGAVYEGSIAGRFGNRKPPSSAYATVSPILHATRSGEFTGGNFWDGRATGEKLGNPAADQAQGPFLNPVEQALPDNACVVYAVCTADDYGELFTAVWGAQACDIDWPDPAAVEAACGSEDTIVDISDEDRAKVDENYDRIALSIAAYEDSPESNAYSSKFDAYQAGLAELTRQEQRGLNLFVGKGRCANCHVIGPGPRRGDRDHDDDDDDRGKGRNDHDDDDDRGKGRDDHDDDDDRGKGRDDHDDDDDGKGDGMESGLPPLFTDFTFDNLGIPRNPDNPWYDQMDFNPAGDAWIDLGLGGFLQTRLDYEQFASRNFGKHKVPTLRNVDLRPYDGFVKAFGHNGYFKSLKGIVHFYNTRDVKPRCEELGIDDATEAEALANDCWPAPEVAANLNTEEMGDLGLSDAEEDAIVAFLRTLNDGYYEP